MLSRNQAIFASALAAATGLSPQAVGAWMLAEEPPAPATTRGDQNWLNVGQFDSGPGAIAGKQLWDSNPAAAAQRTAQFLEGKWGGAAPGIRAILNTRGQSPQAQLAAIAASPWASSHYGGAARLQSLLGSVGSVPKTSASVTPSNIAGVSSPFIGTTPGSSNIFTTLSALESSRQLASGNTSSTPSVLQQGWDELASLIAPNQGQPKVPNSVRNNLSLQSGPGGSDVNPLHGWNIGRTDMGVDASASVGMPIRAPNNSVVVHIYPNWYNQQPYLLMRLVSGPNRGKYYYVAEQIDHLPQVGTYIRRGQPVARFAPSGTGIEMGWGTPGWQTLAQAQGNTGDASHGNAPAGLSFKQTFGVNLAKQNATPQPTNGTVPENQPSTPTPLPSVGSSDPSFSDILSPKTLGTSPDWLAGSNPSPLRLPKVL